LRPQPPIETRRAVEVPASAEQVWAALGRVQDYPRWWPWLRHLDARSLSAGERWACTIKPPLPWSLQLEIVLDEVVDGALRATVTGDVEGRAAVAVRPSGDAGTEIALDATLHAGGGATGALHRVAPRLSRWAHDRVIDRAFAQFRERAI
jgi:uncharacterized membrane protein